MANGGVFGLTPGQVRAQIAREQAGQIALLSQARPGIIGGFTLGGAFQGQDPRIQRAQAMQEIQRMISSRGLNPGDPGFRQMLVPLVRSRVGLEAAMEANRMALEAEQAESEIAAVRRRTTAGRRALRRLGYSEAEADDLAALGLAGDVIKARTKPPELSAKGKAVRDAGFVPGTPEFQAQMREQLKPRPGVQISIGDKVQTAVATQEAKAAAAQGREALEVQRAVGRVREIGEEFRTGGILERGASALTPAMRKRYDLARRRLAKATAQLRNPGDAEAASVAEESIYRSLPGPEQIALFPAMLEEIAAEFQLEASQNRPQRPVRVLEDIPVEDLSNMTEEELRALVQ